MKLSELGVKRPVTTLMVFMCVLILGLVSYSYLAVDMMPEIESPTISVFTMWEGASTEDVESKITRVIEASLGSVTDLDEITSSTSEGVSRVTCKFKWGTELGEAANDMRDLLERAKRSLPDDADDPMMFKFNTSNMPILFFGITAKENIGRVDDIVNEEIVDVLKRVPGVGSAEAFGGLERQINVHLDPDKLSAYGLSLENVAAAINAENMTEPAGNIKIGTLDYTIRIPGEFDNPTQIADVIVKRDGSALVRLSDLARIEDGFIEENGIVESDGNRAMMMMVQKRSGENTVAVCDRVLAKIEDIKKHLPADFAVYLINDNSDMIKKSIKSVGKTIMYGGFFVILTTLFFLRSLRTSLVIALTIPFSLIIAFIFMFLMGWTINIMSMSALAIAIGMVVDNAVVVLENITSHISRGTGRREASMFGADEVGQAVVASTLTTVVVFLPLVFVEGVAGIMMQQLGGLITATLSASLVCALYLTPMLASKLLKQTRPGEEAPRQNRFQKWSERVFERVELGYSKALSWAIRLRWLIVVIAALVMVGTALLFSRIGSEFLGTEDTGQLQIQYELPLSTRYEVTTETGRRIVEVVKEIVGEKNITVMSLAAGGTGGWFGGSRSSHTGTVRMRMVSESLRGKSADEYGAEITARISKWPEITKAYANSSSFLNRILMAGGANLSIDVYGYDLGVGTDIAKKIVGIANAVKGTRNVRIAQDMGKPELAVKVDRDKAASLELSMYDITTAVNTLFQGTATTEYREEEDGYDVLLRLDEKHRRTIEDIRRSALVLPSGKVVRLDTVADIVETTGPVTISRKNQERIVTVELDTIDRPQGDVINDIRAQIEKTILMPSGTTIEYGGMIEEQKDSEKVMLMMIVLGVILVYMVMAAQFESFIHPLIIMFSIPFAFSGVAATLYMTGTPLSMTAYIGVILLIGIVVNNAIILIDYINLLRTRGVNLREAIVDSGRQRLRPVLITTLTTILGMLPMAISTSEGSASWRPLGLVVVGGLTVSTLVTMVIVPVLYYIVEFHRSKARKERTA